MPIKDARVIAAFADCLTQLDGDASLSDCLATYPRFADELHPMLESVNLLKACAISEPIPTPQQLESMRAAYLKQVRPPKRIFVQPKAFVAMAATIAAVIIGVGTLFAVRQEPESAQMAIQLPSEVSVAISTETETATATVTETVTTTETPTSTETGTVTATETGTTTTTATVTETETPTETETETETPTATETGTTTTTATVTETETPTETETETETPTETPTMTSTPTNTATRTPTATRTATNVPQVAQVYSAPQPSSNNPGGSTSYGGSSTSWSGVPRATASYEVQEPLDAVATHCILDDDCVLLDDVANTGGIKADNATTLIFTADQNEIVVDIDFDSLGEASCVAGYCVVFQSNETVFWYILGHVADISYIQFWDFSDDTDQDGVPDEDDECPTDADDECEDEDFELMTICHIPPGNSDDPYTIVVAESALEAHFAHGDTLGECAQP